MQMSQVAKYKDILVEKRNQLLESLDKIDNSKMREEPLDPDFDEQSQEIVNDEVVDALDVMEGEELKKVNQALSRIDNGSYGVCLSCNEQISDARLKAVPFASFCIDCADS